MSCDDDQEASEAKIPNWLRRLSRNLKICAAARSCCSGDQIRAVTLALLMLERGVVDVLVEHGVKGMPMQYGLAPREGRAYREEKVTSNTDKLPL
jgi:hypothetical protein